MEGYRFPSPSNGGNPAQQPQQQPPSLVRTTTFTLTRPPSSGEILFPSSPSTMQSQRPATTIPSYVHLSLICLYPLPLSPSPVRQSLFFWKKKTDFKIEDIARNFLRRILQNTWSLSRRQRLLQEESKGTSSRAFCLSFICIQSNLLGVRHRPPFIASATFEAPRSSSPLARPSTPLRVSSPHPRTPSSPFPKSLVTVNGRTAQGRPIEFTNRSLGIIKSNGPRVPLHQSQANSSGMKPERCAGCMKTVLIDFGKRGGLYVLESSLVSPLFLLHSFVCSTTSDHTSFLVIIDVWNAQKQCQHHNNIPSEVSPPQEEFTCPQSSQPPPDPQQALFLVPFLQFQLLPQELQHHK